MESIGETLRATRHDKKLSIADAARATKVKPEILEQLEAGEFHRIAAPAYTKGFLKLYAEYLGLDSQQLVEAYVTSQGGLRRQGLTIETEAAARARKPRELELPLRRVVWLVVGLTALLVVLATARVLGRHHARPAAKPAPVATTPIPPAAGQALPKAGFDAYYQPQTRPAPELLELPAKER